MQLENKNDAENAAVTQSFSQEEETNNVDTQPISEHHGAKENGAETAQVDYWNRDRIFSIINFSFSSFCLGNFYSLLGPFFPQEATKKGASSTEIGIIFACFEGVIMLSTPFFGTFLTRIGAKFIYIAGMFVCGSGSILFGFLDLCPSGPVFVGLCFAVRSLEGLGTSAYLTAAFAITANTFPDRAASMLGILDFFYGLGMMVAPPIGGILYELGGYRLPFVLSGGVMLFVAMVSCILLPPQNMPHQERKGSMFTMLRIPLVTIMVLFITACAVTISFLDVALALRLEDVFHFSPLVISLLFLVGPGLYTVCTPVFGCIADAVNNRLVLALLACGYFINFIGCLLLGPAPFLLLPNNLLYLVILGLMTMGTGLGTMVSTFKIINDTVLQRGFEENLDTFGLVSGLINTFFSLGAFACPLVVGCLVDTVGFEWTAFSVGCFSAFLVTFMLKVLSEVICLFVFLLLDCSYGNHQTPQGIHNDVSNDSSDAGDTFTLPDWARKRNKAATEMTPLVISSR